MIMAMIIIIIIIIITHENTTHMDDISLKSSWVEKSFR